VADGHAGTVSLFGGAGKERVAQLSRRFLQRLFAHASALPCVSVSSVPGHIKPIGQRTDEANFLGRRSLAPELMVEVGHFEFER
jgi:hypothetical protein